MRIAVGCVRGGGEGADFLSEQPRLMDLRPLKLLESGEPANSRLVSWPSETEANYIRVVSCVLKCLPCRLLARREIVGESSI